MFFWPGGGVGGWGGPEGSKSDENWPIFGQFWPDLVQTEKFISFSGEFGPKLTFFAIFVKFVGFRSEIANPSGDSHTNLNFLAESPECTLGPPPWDPPWGVLRGSK